MKRLIATLVGYLAVTSMLAGGLLGGILWLIRTDGAESAPVRVAALPPRIADSIERKKDVVPPQAPPVASLPVKPMQEANVALSQPVAAKWFIRELTPPPPKKRKRQATKQPSDRRPTNPTVSSYATPVRSDNLSGL
jgi:hypothetical protein